MLTKTKKRIEYLNIILLMCTFIFVGSFYVYADETPADKALQLKWKIDNFRMHLTAELKEEVLKEITAKDSKNRLTELGNWPYAPLEVASSIANGDIRIRFEKDFVVIWYHSPVSLVNGKSTLLDVVRDAINDILGEAFVIGEDDTLVAQGSGSAKNPKTELVMATWPKEIPGTKAITCSYYSASHHKRDWKCLVSTVHVLVKDKDVIIVMGKLKARTYQKPIHEGLVAAKARLTKKQAEKAKSKPILARNVIFGKEIDTKDISDRLLNGCMWPVDNEIAVGVKDVGSANKLREIKGARLKGACFRRSDKSVSLNYDRAITKKRHNRMSCALSRRITIFRNHGRWLSESVNIIHIFSLIFLLSFSLLFTLFTPFTLYSPYCSRANTDCGV